MQVKLSPRRIEEIEKILSSKGSPSIEIKVKDGEVAVYRVESKKIN